MVNATTGAALTGATVTGRRIIDGTAAALDATISEPNSDGFYQAALSQADTNGNDIGYFFTALNAVPVAITAVITVLDPTSTAFGLSLAKTTNITGLNDIAATDVVSSGAITTSAGKVSGVILTDTLTTYTGNTKQTADVATLITTVGVAGAGLTAVALADATSDAVIADAVWNAATATYGAAGSYGLLVETDLDTTISSRMATYTQPTGFLAATFPTGTVANTTNISAGTITTTTNLTNLPTIPTNWITAAGIADAAIDAATFATGAIDAAALAADAGTEIGTAVWASATRLLTAGTNIVLAKGVGITGFNDIAITDIVSGGSIITSGGLASADVKKINSTTVTGTGGLAGAPWGPT